MLYQRALVIKEEVYGADHPAVAASLTKRATLLEDQVRRGSDLYGGCGSTCCWSALLTFLSIVLSLSAFFQPWNIQSDVFERLYEDPDVTEPSRARSRRCDWEEQVHHRHIGRRHGAIVIFTDETRRNSFWYRWI